jgi:hypothetical protein
MELEASMFMVVASCWILMTNWPFFSRWMASSWVSWC